MKNPKQEAIEKAWIAEIGEEKFELLKPYLDYKDGSLKVIWEYDLLDQLRDILGESIQETSKFYFDGYSLHLVSLKGIENNNGWTRIEPYGNNLPTDPGLDFYVGRLSQNHFTQFNSIMNCASIIGAFRDGRITHYKLIEKPKPPLY